MTSIEDRPGVGRITPEPLDITPRPAEQDATGWSAKIHSVRFRVVAAMVGMMLAGLAGSGLIAFTIQFEDTEAKIDQAILDKATSLVRIVTVNGTNSKDSESRRLHEVAEDIEPRSNEVMAGIVNGGVAWTVEGSPHSKLMMEALFPAAAGLRDPDGPAFGEFDLAGRPLRVVVVPLISPAGPPSTYLLVGRDAGDQWEHNLASVRTYVLVALGTLLAAAAIGSVIAGRLLDPLRRLREATRVVSHEDLTQRVEVRDGADDVTLLAKTFNTMLERLDEGAQQQQQFLDDAGHELRTPITILRGHLELVAVDDPADVIATRDVLLDEVDRMQRLVDDLLLLANSGHPDFLRKEPIRTSALLHQVMEKVHVLAHRNWHLDETADYLVEADPQRLTQALVQLAANAVKYTGPGSTIGLGCSVEGPTAPDGAPLAAADTLLLWVRDDGTGIAVEDQQRIFERFGRAHPGRGQEGAGLGLAIVTAIAQAHGGTAAVESEYGHGSSFLIRIPLQDAGIRI
ncbi:MULTISPECIES: cell wall metabolism sensor histidine kinase WalK [Arthrobacter]|uniref:histidine kinase n=1 Tax=Arthrobacter oryzae TaxID=409290 RepID=A0A3N0C9T7_9MICC|nr:MULTISPECIES: HAMP domain-containing sensor histidine kinase [Arthrobacter]QYF89121.1 HAMP domain-containing histidine kinase [Arthrobacter sp. PAMC25284]RNL60224.1 sensor histidine kinase [Arthrobacter oryzae]